MLNEIKEYKDFGIRFDYNESTWHLILPNLAKDKDYSKQFCWSQQMKQNQMLVGWYNLQPNGETYTIKSRQLEMYFPSKEETRFYFDDSVKIYDSVTGNTVRDNVKVLGVNYKPGEKVALDSDYSFDIVGMETEVDGYKDNTKVKVTFSDSDLDTITDNPESFDKVVGIDDIEAAPSARKFVFLKAPRLRQC